jgi:nitrogenase subunit NifH
MLNEAIATEDLCKKYGSITAVKNLNLKVYAKTVIEHRPESKMADLFRGLAKRIYENEEVVVPTPLSKRDLAELAQKISRKG